MQVHIQNMKLIRSRSWGQGHTSVNKYTHSAERQTVMTKRRIVLGQFVCLFVHL